MLGSTEMMRRRVHGVITTTQYEEVSIGHFALQPLVTAAKDQRDRRRRVQENACGGRQQPIRTRARRVVSFVQFLRDSYFDMPRISYYYHAWQTASISFWFPQQHIALTGTEIITVVTDTARLVILVRWPASRSLARVLLLLCPPGNRSLQHTIPRSRTRPPHRRRKLKRRG